MITDKEVIAELLMKLGKARGEVARLTAENEQLMHLVQTEVGLVAKLAQISSENALALANELKAKTEAKK